MNSREQINHSHSVRLFDPRYARPVTVLGAGSVGSQVIPMLARIGVTDITVYDADDVRSHNLPMTLGFGLSDLGRYKVDVVHDRVFAETGIGIKARRVMYTGEKLKGSIICCVDTMEARQAVWNQARGNPLVDLLVDTRTHEHFLSVYAIRPAMPEDIAFYDTRLYSSKEVLRPTCGSHGIVYVSAVAASFAVRALTSSWNGDIPAPHEQLLFGTNGTAFGATSTQR